jgi:beta-lactamase class A
MKLFGNKRTDEEDYDDEEIESSYARSSRRKGSHLKGKDFKDLKPENRKKRKEPKKPWGKKERFFVGFILALMVGASAILALSARSWKFPGLPRLKVPKFSIPFLAEETIILEGDSKPQGKQKAEKVISEFEARTKNLSGVYGLYVVDLEDGFSYGVNERETIQAASLIKLPIMASVYLEAEKGNIKLSEYRTFLERMGKRSDNSAQIKVVNDIGKETINSYISEIGMRNTSLEENETTPYDIGVFFEKLWNDEILNTDDKEEFLEYLTDTIYESWLTAGVPEGVRVAHKYGREVHVVNDAGIIFSEYPFAVVIMSKGVVETEADKVFPDLTRIVYENQISLRN